MTKDTRLAILLALIAIVVSYVGVALSEHTDKPSKSQEELRARSEYYKHNGSMKGYEYR